MKYVLLLVRADDEWEALTDAERDYPGIERWWAQLAQMGKLVSGGELRPARTATTVAWNAGKPVLMDGPFMEAKESIGGFGVIDVPDRQAAIEVAGTWPARGHRVEVRPLVSR